MIPEHVQDRYEEERSARASADPVERDNDDRPSFVDAISQRPEYCFEDNCTYPECDCWLQEDGSDD